MLIKGKPVEPDLTISTDTIDDCINKQAGLIAYYGSEWAKLENKVRILKIEVDEVYAARETYYRKAQIEGKITEAAIKAMVTVDKQYMNKQREYIDAKYELDKLDVVMKALDNKRDMLGLKVKTLLMEWSPEVSQKVLERDNVALRKAKSEITQVGLRDKIKKLKRS